MFTNELVGLLAISGLAVVALLAAGIDGRRRRDREPPLAINGRRVRLRRLTPGDCDAIAQTIDAEVVLANGWTPAIVDAYVATVRAVSSVDSHLNLAIVDHDGEIVGVITLVLDPHLERSAHLGFWLDAGYRGRGYMTEALGLALQLLPTIGLCAATVHTATDNARTRRVVEGLGFEMHGTYRRRLPNGSDIDAVMYRRLDLVPPAA